MEKEIKIVALTDEQSEALDDALYRFDSEHMPPRLEGKICLGIESGGEVVAGLNAYFTCYRILYLGTLFVQEKYRRKGLGRKLITEMEQRAKEAGVNLIRVDTFDWQGKEFYPAMGYELVGQYRCEEDCFEESFFIKRI